MSQLPIARTDLEDRVVDDEFVILDRDKDAIHQLNATAGFIWAKCDGRHDIETIAEELAEEYGVDLEVTRQDVRAIVTTFGNLGLVDGA